MPKPTLLQSLLKQPSQRYTNITQARDNKWDKYHSVRKDMLRLAAASLPPHPATAVYHTSTPISQEAISEERENGVADQLELELEQQEDSFFTPTSSPRDSGIEQDQLVVYTTPTSLDMGAPQPTLLASPAMDSNDCAKEVNVTDAGPQEEPITDDVKSEPELSRPASASLLPSASLSTTSLDGSASVSEASWSTSFSAPSTSTRATTPATSDSGHTGTGTGSRSSSTRSNNSIRRKKAENRRGMTATYTADDWAKDVRWLVAPPQTTTSAAEKRRTWHSVSRATATSISTTNTTTTRRRSARQCFEFDPTLPYVPLQVRAPNRRAASSSTANSRRAIGRRRMSAVWEEDEGTDEDATPSLPRRVHTDPLASLSSLGRSRSLSSPQRPLERERERTRSPTKSLLSGESGSIGGGSSTNATATSAFTSASRTVDIPNPLPVTDGGMPSGFTSLVLPRAAYTHSSNHKRYSLRFGSTSYVDITRSGLAQTTMSTVSITKNAAAASALGRGGAAGSRPRFLSLTSLHVLAPGSDSGKTKLPKTPAHLLGTLPRPLSFTSHTPPPSKVNSQQILVQVYAVALGGLDDRIVSEKSARKDCYGFVPGRSFVGRAVEVGFEVNNVAKSDWVVGLLDVRKCGALAEFVIVEKRRIARCPRPSSALTPEQLALLPLCGVPAHRAVRTAGVDTDTERDSVSARALVLQGHDSAGALAVQALAHAGLHVTAHIPHHADTPRIRTPSTSSDLSSSSPSDEPDTDYGGSGSGSEHSSTREAEERVRRWGARGVRIGDALEVVENCDAGAFDLVIDTVGGKRIWEACQRVVAASGQFTTLVGDTSPSPSPSYSPPNSSHPSPASSPHSPFAPFFLHHHHHHHHHHSKSHSEEYNNRNQGGRAIPSIHAHFRANFRSIRRAFRARKAIGYALVSPAADVDQFGEDVRDSLVEAVRRAVSGVFVPFVGDGNENGNGEKEAVVGMGKGSRRKGRGRVVPFECAPELFGCGALSDGRTAVVRVVD